MTKSIIIFNNSIYIEDYKSIEYFDEKLIKISCKSLDISVEGLNLQIDSYNKYSIKISGKINIIQYENKGEVIYE